MLKDIECLRPRKRKHIPFLDGARLIFQLEDTDFYLIYVKYKGEHWDRTQRKYVEKRNGWFWYRVRTDYVGVFKSVEPADFYDVLDDSNLPTEVLFNLDTLRKLENSKG